MLPTCERCGCEVFIEKYGHDRYVMSDEFRTYVPHDCVRSLRGHETRCLLEAEEYRAKIAEIERAQGVEK